MIIEKSCFNYDGDEDCHKCAAYGYIYSCPNPCPEYHGLYPQIDPYENLDDYVDKYDWEVKMRLVGKRVETR